MIAMAVLTHTAKDFAEQVATLPGSSRVSMQAASEKKSALRARRYRKVIAFGDVAAQVAGIVVTLGHLPCEVPLSSYSTSLKGVSTALASTQADAAYERPRPQAHVLPAHGRRLRTGSAAAGTAEYSLPPAASALDAKRSLPRRDPPHP